ncbi:putative magnesium transporter NIPA4 [Neolecta irregularis DAH-3]|uniref:Putative magnesium transporter NIPA4 n=1 Tax=Neolecta irregularis (strain DAH-3) TaxID=1198029 RepID=A0A1U7LWL8_NEOID|nr:putative magnesium transporter NIPA4 [Neolecta irregularis DAH-3]|eukprot:OLL27019.1 putative magnesium transporter NIPA4 [Neolecta irregularis DAH-3]
MVEDKYIGLGLAISSSAAIASSLPKKSSPLSFSRLTAIQGLIDASENREAHETSYSFLRNPIWWAGMTTMAVGEIANFAAYTFAPAILVTPLGALSVLIGAVLAAVFLREELGILGKLGCAICLIGSIIIVLHAPADQEITTVDEILEYALHPGFLVYCVSVTIFSLFMIYRVAPKYGQKNPLVYISICSTVGSVSVMSIKGFGIALKLTLAGNNQFSHPSTYVFAIVVLVCILIQMNYFNKALDTYSTSIVNPLYYVTFTTATLCASFILFRGFNTTNAVNTISLLCGFLIIFSGVYLLNASRIDPNGHHLLPDKSISGMPMDAMSGGVTRRSMQIHRSQGPRLSNGSLSQDTHLISTFDEESFAMTELDEFNADDDDHHTHRLTPMSSRPLR